VQIQLISPVFHEKSNVPSDWRKDIEATWRYLCNHYKIELPPNTLGGTTIYISASKYTLLDIKRIAQATVHFESTLDVLAPARQIGRQRINRNWRDNDRLKNLSQSEAMTAIEDTTSLPQFLQLIHPSWSLSTYRWDFTGSIPGRLHVRYRPYIIFRSAPLIETASDPLWCTEFALSTVRGAIACRSLAHLQKIPRNHEGLREFLSGVRTNPGSTVY